MQIAAVKGIAEECLLIRVLIVRMKEGNSEAALEEFNQILGHISEDKYTGSTPIWQMCCAGIPAAPYSMSTVSFGGFSSRFAR